MKYDFDTIIDRDPAKYGTGKYRIMKDSKGQKPPKGTVPLSVADMEFRVAPEIIEAIKAEADYGVFGYHRITDDFRASCCEWMKKRHQWEISPDWIVPMEQVVPSIYNAMFAFTNEGDGILMQMPVYHHFFHTTEKLNRKVVVNELVIKDGKYCIDFDDFREKAKQAKIFLLCSPHNPVGRVWTEEELRKMGEICLENNVLVVADEIHHDLVFAPHKHFVYANLGEEFAQNCIVTTALSKTFNLAGLCYSSIIIPNKEIREKFQKQMNLQGFHHISRFGPVAAEAAYRHGEAWLEELLDYIWGNYEFLKTYMAEKFPGVIVHDLEGTYLPWLDFSCLGKTTKELYDFLTDEAYVYLDSGNDFGQGGEGFQRINIACPREILENALNRFYEAAKLHHLID